jgi:hypothetical protein
MLDFSHLSIRKRVIDVRRLRSLRIAERMPAPSEWHNGCAWVPPSRVVPPPLRLPSGGATLLSAPFTTHINACARLL